MSKNKKGKDKTIRIVENGEEKTTTTQTIKKVKLDKEIDSDKLSSIIDKVKNGS